ELGIVEVLEISGGRSPLIIEDLDVYPQLPRPTGAPTLNSEEPVMGQNVVCDFAGAAECGSSLGSREPVGEGDHLSDGLAPGGAALDQAGDRLGQVGRTGLRVPVQGGIRGRVGGGQALVGVLGQPLRVGMGLLAPG